MHRPLFISLFWTASIPVFNQYPGWCCAGLSLCLMCTASSLLRLCGLQGYDNGLYRASDSHSMRSSGLERETYSHRELSDHGSSILFHATRPFRVTRCGALTLQSLDRSAHQYVQVSTSLRRARRLCLVISQGLKSNYIS